MRSLKATKCKLLAKDSWWLTLLSRKNTSYSSKTTQQYTSSMSMISWLTVCYFGTTHFLVVLSIFELWLRGRKSTIWSEFSVLCIWQFEYISVHWYTCLMISFKIYLSGVLTFIVGLLQIYTYQPIINNMNMSTLPYPSTLRHYYLEFSITLTSKQSKEFAY